MCERVCVRVCILFFVVFQMAVSTNSMRPNPTMFSFSFFMWGGGGETLMTGAIGYAWNLLRPDADGPRQLVSKCHQQDKHQGTESNTIARKIFDLTNTKYRQLKLAPEKIEQLTDHFKLMTE